MFPLPQAVQIVQIKKVKSNTYVVEVAAEGRENPPKEFDPRTPAAPAADVVPEVEEEAGAGTAGCSVAVAVAVGRAPNDKDAEIPILEK
jgi:hypothetical protein